MTSSHRAALTPPKSCPRFVFIIVPALAAVAIAPFAPPAAAEAPLAELVELATPIDPVELAPVVQAIDDEELLRENARLRDDVERLEGLLADIEAGDIDGLNREVLRLRAEVDRYREALSSALAELRAHRAPTPPTAISEQYPIGPPHRMEATWEKE